jgi:hypothetical protein
MIANIIDNRKRRYRWKKINAIIEPTYQDIDIDDADEIDDPGPDAPVHDRQIAISVADAIAWAWRGRRAAAC